MCCRWVVGDHGKSFDALWELPCISAHIFTGRGALLVVFCHLACWRAPCSSQKLCLCPSPPCPSCQSPASDCGCGPCHTWMQGHAVGSHMCESLWKWMQGRIYSWLAKRNNCGCYYESSICATCKTTACICNHPVTAQLKYEFGLAS